MIKVSVIIPVYNTSKYLVRCLNSVRNQTLEDIEVIIVNDGSTDDSEIICKDFINNHNLNWKVSSKPNGGLSSARRYGWEQSSGECIVFVDSDDEILPDYCKLLYEAIVKTGSQLSMCGYYLCNGGSRVVKIPEIKKKVIVNVPLEYGKRLIFDTSYGDRIPGFLWMRMMKRSHITEDCFINENKVYSEDQIFDLVYSKVVKRIVFVPKALYNYYVNMGSLTLKYRPNMLEMTVNLQKFYYDFLKSNNLLDDAANYEFAKNIIEGSISSLINALRFGNLKDVKKVIKGINGLGKYQESLYYLRENSYLTQRQKLWCFIINNNISLLLFLFYRARNIFVDL